MSADRVLVLNAGSSSLKAGVFAPAPGGFLDERAVLTAEASGLGQGGGSLHVKDAGGNELTRQSHSLDSPLEALDALVDALEQHGDSGTLAAIGHRVVHGGPGLVEHALLTPATLAELKRATHYAPLHLPMALAMVERAERRYPRLPQCACFDTAFHRTLPPVASRLPVPQQYADAGVRRYGFHGLSYESIVAQLAPLPDRVVAAHLGSGASLCAMYKGRSIDTSMGMTPTGGIPMATRTGDLDPGALLFLMRNGRLDDDALETLLNHKSGLEAIGGAADFRELERRAADPSATGRNRAAAALALDIFAEAVAKTVASYIVSLSGLDLLVFTGGIGEHSSTLREAVVRKLAPLGIALKSASGTGAGVNLASHSSTTGVQVLEARENPVIAAHTRRMALGLGRRPAVQ